jgi:DNA-binding response OmpR family regulator
VGSTSLRPTVADRALPAGKVQTPVHVLSPPGLLRCLILSWSDQRAQRLKQAAERESWEVIACSGTGKFLQYVFREKVPLTLVDLPAIDVDSYSEWQNVTAKVREVSESLLIICGAKESDTEEKWARELGVWTYVPDASRPKELDWVFVEARKALAQQASARVDSSAIQVTTEAHLRLDGKT